MKKLLSTLFIFFIIFIMLAKQDSYAKTQKQDYRTRLWNLHIGNLFIEPYAVLKYMYDTNIFLTNLDRKADNITVETLGFSSVLPQPKKTRFYAKVDYAIDRFQYWSYNHFNRFDHRLASKGQYRLGDTWTVNGFDYFIRTADPPDTEQTGLRRRCNNLGGFSFDYETKPFGLQIGYQNILDAYSDKQYQYLDKQDHRGVFLAYYKIRPKIRMSVEYNNGYVFYDHKQDGSAGGKNSLYHQIRLGFEGKLFNKVRGILRGGFQQRDYHSTQVGDESRFVAQMIVLYQIYSRALLRTEYERGINDSSYRDVKYFTYDMVKTSLFQHVGKKCVFIVNSGWGRNQYPEATQEGNEQGTREDILWAGGVSVRYAFLRWMDGEFGYEYKQRDSKFSVFDYKDHKVMGKVTIRL